MSVQKRPLAALALDESQAVTESCAEPGETSGIRTRNVTEPPLSVRSQPEDASSTEPVETRPLSQPPMLTISRADRTRAAAARKQAVGFLLTKMLEAPKLQGFLFYSPMEGRVLDTALTLHLLQKHTIDFLWQERLRHYVEVHLRDGDLFSSTVAHSVLVISRDGSHRRDDPVYSAGHGRLLQGLKHARRRKKALLGTLLAEVSAISFDSVTFDPDLFSDEVTHLFSQIYFAALKIIHGSRRGAPAEALADDIAFLQRTQDAGGSWEQQSLLTIVALTALGPASPSFARGLDFLRRMTRDDGGVAFCDNLNLWTTGLAGLALIDGDDLTRTGLYSVTEYIVSLQQPSGGWAFSEDVTQTDTDTTAQCVQLLLELDKERYAPQIEAAHAHFAARQRPDGGYPTYEVAGESEATMTANIALIQAMSIEEHPEFHERIERALDFLCTHQSPDGTFERSWSLSEIYSMFRVAWAFNVCEPLVSSAAIDEARRRSVSYLITTQQPDGGWGHTSTSPSDALSTAYALLSLQLFNMPVHRAHFSRGLDYLLSQQDPLTGEIVSIPDVVGPRPIVFNIPLLSTVFAVMALRALETRKLW